MFKTDLPFLGRLNCLSLCVTSFMYNGMCMYNGLLIPCKHANIPANTAPKNTGGYLITFNLTSLAGSLRLVFLILALSPKAFIK